MQIPGDVPKEMVSRVPVGSERVPVSIQGESKLNLPVWWAVEYTFSTRRLGFGIFQNAFRLPDMKFPTSDSHSGPKF